MRGRGPGSRSGSGGYSSHGYHQGDQSERNDRANIDRSKLRAVQTPQTFKAEVIRKALGVVQERGIAVTDDTAACDFINQPVKLVESTTPNIKATSPEDIPYLELLLKK